MYRSRKFLKWTAERPPVLPGTGDTVPHHVRGLNGGGTSLKPPDTHTLPISDSAHQKLDSPGNSERSVFDESGYSFEDVKAMIEANIKEYLEDNNIDSTKLAIDLLTNWMEENRI